MKKKKLNILMAHNFYLIGGGEHTVFQNEKELLTNNGHKVTTYTRNNLEIKNSLLKKIFLPFTAIWSFKTYFEVKRIIKQQNIDILHCHNTFPLISPSIYYAAMKMNVPVIQTIHNFRLLCPGALFYRNGKICENCLKNNNFKDALKYKCYRNSRFQTFVIVCMIKFHKMLGTYKKINYIFLTDFNREKFSKLLGNNFENAFIKPNFVNKINEKINSKKEKKFIFVGRLDQNKGIKFLISSWKKLNTSFELHIYGDGALREYVEKEVSDSNNIIYFGFKPHNVIFEDLSSSYALIFPSEWYEGYPMTIAESFSIGVPVICTNIGNQSTIINDSSGGNVFKINDYESFKYSIDEIIKNNIKFSNNAEIYYNNVLTPESNYKQIISIYENVYNKKIEK